MIEDDRVYWSKAVGPVLIRIDSVFFLESQVRAPVLSFRGEEVGEDKAIKVEVIVYITFV